MKIKKLGHACMVIDIEGARIMIDPGKYSTLQNKEENINLILITHEHQDHFDIESIKEIMAHNPLAVIVTNSAVGKLLDEAKIRHQILEDKQSGEFFGVHVEAFGDKHAFVMSGFPIAQNTGYFIGERFFFPGDAFTVPHKPVQILALPVGGPWLKIDDVFQYAQKVNPKTVFPVHDAIFNELGLQSAHRWLGEVLKPFGINLRVLEIGKEEEF